MDTKGLQKEFIDWCKSNKKQPKSKEETQQLFVTFMKEKHPEEYKAAMENQLKQAQKALHGAKLQYVRSLKHQCPEGEELYYYKKGGSVGCGCKKKMEEGGQTPKNKNNAIDKFKNRKQDLATKDSIAVNNYGAEDIEATRPGTYKKNKEGKIQWTPDRTKAPYNKTPKKEKGGKTEKDCGGYKMKLKKKGGEVCPKCGKVHSVGTNCAVAKFKMHRLGGSLNGIPFMQNGTPKGGLPTAEKATKRYKGARGIMYGNNDVTIQEIENPNNRAKIELSILGNDSTITETPPHSWYITPVKRYADNYMPLHHNWADKEWNIMKRRWEEAKKVMSKVPYYAGPLYGTYPLPK